MSGLLASLEQGSRQAQEGEWSEDKMQWRPRAPSWGLEMENLSLGAGLIGRNAVKASIFVSTSTPGPELGLATALAMQATLSRALGLTSMCGVLTYLGLCWSWLLHQVTDWRFPQQNRPWKWRRRKESDGLGAFGQLLEVRTRLRCHLLVALW